MRGSEREWNGEIESELGLNKLHHRHVHLCRLDYNKPTTIRNSPLSTVVSILINSIHIRTGNWCRIQQQRAKKKIWNRLIFVQCAACLAIQSGLRYIVVCLSIGFHRNSSNKNQSDVQATGKIDFRFIFIGFQSVFIFTQAKNHEFYWWNRPSLWMDFTCYWNRLIGQKVKIRSSIFIGWTS